MKRKKVNPWAKRLPYPRPVQTRSGCKVSWYYYETLVEAEVASKAAYHNSLIAAAEGYDFGYCAPGSIRQIKESWIDRMGGTAYKQGWYEVCLP